MKSDAIIFSRTTLPANQSTDGETPSFYAVTQEVSGHAVWHYSSDHGTRFVKFFWGWSGEGAGSRDEAVLFAVRASDAEIEALLLAKAGPIKRPA